MPQPTAPYDLFCPACFNRQRNSGDEETAWILALPGEHSKRKCYPRKARKNEWRLTPKKVRYKVLRLTHIGKWTTFFETVDKTSVPGKGVIGTRNSLYRASSTEIFCMDEMLRQTSIPDLVRYESIFVEHKAQAPNNFRTRLLNKAFSCFSRKYPQAWKKSFLKS